MLRTFSFPLYSGSLAEYQNWDEMRAELKQLDCDGIEAIWGGEEFPTDIPADLVVGYHLIFFPDWLDHYREDRTALEQKFGSLEVAEGFYGGLGQESLQSQYRDDLERAVRLGAQYVVFHVSDVSLEEGCTYRWLHSDEEVIDASVELINSLLDGRDWPFYFLVENQWWPGFTFTEPEKTARLLNGIHYPKKGIMLDIGHLMNSSTAIRSQAEGAAFVHKMLDLHGPLAREIRGVHLHQSVSGTYVEANVGTLPADLPTDYYARYAASYAHIQQIDTHKPWTDPAICGLIDRINPMYLTHELSAPDRAARFAAVRQQTAALNGSGNR